MRPLTYLALLLGLWTALGSASPQQPGELVPVISARTDLVTLTVSVVDRRGGFVTGLRPEHFTVYDSGEPQTIQVFTSEDIPATIGLVIDSSGSMRGRRNLVAAAAAAFADMSHPLDEFFTVNFNEYVWLGLPPDVAFTEDMDELGAALSAAPSYGMTALYDAVDRALDHLQLGSRDRRALIVVSDGGDNASSQTLDAVLEHARRAGAVIYSVTLDNLGDRDANPRVLRKLAGETGARTFTPGSADEVMRSFAQIAREIRSAYTIGFAPTATSDVGFRPIRVVVDGGDRRGLTARTRAGYYAGPSSGTAR